MFTPSSRDWVKVLRLTPIIIGSILVFSFTDFGLAVTYAKQLYHAPLDESKWDNAKDKGWSIAWFFLYSGFLPFLSFVHATIDASLFFFAQLNPVCTLTLSVLLFIGWIIQISLWCHCDYTPSSGTCYQFYVVENHHSEMSGSLNGVSNRATVAKVVFGMVVLILYTAYLALAAAAVQKMRITDHVRIDNDEDQELEDRYSMEYRQILFQSLEHPTSQSSFLKGGIGV